LSAAAARSHFATVAAGQEPQEGLWPAASRVRHADGHWIAAFASNADRGRRRFLVRVRWQIRNAAGRPLPALTLAPFMGNKVTRSADASAKKGPTTGAGSRGPESPGLAEGKDEFELVDGDFRRNMPLARRRDELDMPPSDMFRFIKKPSLALSGEFDLNVPPNHSAKIVQVIRAAGNHGCTCAQIPKADHSFQISAADAGQRVKERYTFASFKREYSSEVYEEMANWLDSTLGYSASVRLPGKVAAEPLPARAVEAPERDAKTANSPARLHLAPGIQIVEDITDKSQTTSVSTLEGAIGPLLLGEGCQAHFIDMPIGMYCEEHPHSSESIIYTVRGSWVLCSKGRRQVMKAGTLFHFAPNTPTGYETPFKDGALILIFKGQRLTKKEDEFIAYLQGLANRLEREHQAGVPYRLSDLPKDHPAIKFAQEMQAKVDNP
jgi:pimeloyl-ACP methyl ester carboxylesterase/quercetin dioxygenase-like cupin family protein